MTHPYFSKARHPRVLAHRGLITAAGEDSGVWENTAASFAAAHATGADYIETDCQVTADGDVVLFHDATLERLLGDRRAVREVRTRELRSVFADHGGLLTVAEALSSFPQIRFNIDVKAGSGVAPTVETVTRAGAGERVLLASFSDARLARVRALAGPRVATALGRAEVARLRLSSWAGTPLRLPASAVAAQVPTRHGRVPIVDRRFLARAHRLGLQVHVWTIDDPVEMGRLLDLGVDGIMTDRPEVLREVYATRGLPLS